MMRWIYRIVAALVVCVLVVVGLLFLLPTDRIGQLASDQLERQTGRKLTLSGDFSPTIYPTLGVKTGAITISNADWATDDKMISAEAVSVGVNLSALIGGTLEIDKIDLQSPVIYLERAKDGRVNWDVSTATTSSAPTPTDGAAASQTPSLELGEITNGRVIFRDAASGTITDVSEINGTVSLPKGTTTAAVDIAAVVDGLAGAVDATVADWKSLTEGGASQIDGTLSIAGASATLNGTLGLSDAIPSVDATFTGKVPNLTSVATALNIALPAQAAQLANLDLSGTLKSSATGLEVDAKATGDYAKQALTGAVVLTGDEKWMTSQSFEMSARAGLAKATAAFDGRVNGAKTLASGRLQASAADLGALLRVFDVSVAAPAGTLQSAAVKGALTVGRDANIALGGATISVDNNTVTGDVNITSQNTPYIAATLGANQLDFSKFISDSSTTSSDSGAGATTTGWSKDRITLTGLDAVNADITLNAKGVDLGVTKLGLTSIKGKLRDGQLVLNLRDVRAYQGAVAGTITVRGGNSVAFASDVRANDVQLKPLLGELLDIDRLSGSGDTMLKLSGSGQSIHQIMTSLSGSGSVEFGNGAIRGIDLAAMMRNLKSAFGGFEGATEFTNLSGTFTMEKGVLQNVDLSLVSPLFKAAGKGSVDVGGQSMNYTVTPTSLAKDAEFSVPVEITGPWGNLKFRPDVEKLLNLLANTKLKDSEELKKAKEKIDTLKAKVKDPEKTIKEKIVKELSKKQTTNGDTTQQKSLEETAKDKLEQEVGNALKKLFD